MVELKTSTLPQFYDHLWQSLAEGFLILDDQGNVVAANDSAANSLGYKPGELCECAWHAFWPEALPSPLSINLEPGQSYDVEIRQQDGRFSPVNLTLFPLDAAGEGYKLIVLGDPNKVKHVNDALLHTQRLAGVGTLMTGVGHELVTPISIITNICSNMRAEIEEDTLGSEDLMRYVQMIEQSVWRCTRIVDVLRHYTVNDAPHMAVTDLKMIIEDALTLVKHQFQGDFQVEVEKDLAPDLKTIVCDHNRLTQVLVNLLINARDAMQPDGGTIRIKTWAIPSVNPPRHLDNPVSRNGGTAVPEYAISIQDTGTGIDPAIMNQIFNPFFTSKPTGKGTGLGLYLARQIIEQHNGRIWAENNPDIGAMFTIVIPR